MAIFRRESPWRRRGRRMQVGEAKLVLRSVTAAPWTVVSLMALSDRVFVDCGYRTTRRHSRSSVTVYSARPTKSGLALYTVTAVRESCVWQQGSTLCRRQQNRIELYALVNLKPKYISTRKDCARRFVPTIEANYWQTRSIARPLCDSRRAILVGKQHYTTLQLAKVGAFLRHSVVSFFWDWLVCRRSEFR